MDGFARPAGPRPPQPHAQPHPHPQPQFRPQSAPEHRPQSLPEYRRPAQPEQPMRPGHDPYARQAMPQNDPYARQRPQGQYDDQQAQHREEVADKPSKKRRQRPSSNLSIVVQFVIGLLVIAGVAAAIVALYVRYYQ